MKFPFKKILVSFLLLAPLPLVAQETIPDQHSTSFNPVLLGLVSIIIVLMALIGFLALVYKQLAIAYVNELEKERHPGGIAKTVAMLIAGSLISVNSYAQDAIGTATATETVTHISGIPQLDYYVLVSIIGFQLLAIFTFLGMIYRMVRIMQNIPEREPVLNRLMKLNLLDYFNKSVSIDKEETIVLDHDYDGIRELDNSLPPWWKWGFVMTVVFSVVYMWYYHVNDGPKQIDEYNAAVLIAEQEQATYLAKAGNAIDEHNVKLITEAAELADAGVLFKNTCAACHREDAGGNVGPNLTDAYWLHGGSLPDVFKSVKYGWKDKGMPAWQHNMSAKQIAGLTSYIRSLKGSKVEGGKAPQGDLYVDNSGAASDSTGLAPAREEKGKPIASVLAEKKRG
jgi:cytochrome c oxidase cbb3-type subunit 3